MAYLKRWQKKLELSDFGFALLAKPATKKVPRSSVCPLGDNLYIIWLTPETLTLENDWRDSIVHELLHTLMIKHYWRPRRLSRKTEELLVFALAGLLSRK
jgi:hypothetical protein